MQKHAEVSKSLSFGGWCILYVSTGAADAYVFYAADPSRNKYVTMWGGVALEGEEQEIRDWALKNAPGIPRTLASRFALAFPGDVFNSDPRYELSVSSPH
jgi:hypothetical protein